MGPDRYRVHVQFAIGNDIQWLRWIPLGRLLPGSPKDEPGSDAGEQLRHEATVEDGFLLFATPATQVLYEAAPDESPSRFEVQKKMVQQISWRAA